ncbi:restriction endonuclease subunit S [Aeromonas hydrophila]|uniref:restriction endonuclease subunit S n=1 Tax=Aeromonas hydrophila TaxID=644 RepID=UPI001C5B8BAA|nr:restriction endonuclease subunit S [Aeromonas hydrophila]MBW3808337.1 restriction endonuclease subunit S [Aeromonas hydrophila]
MSSNLLVGHLGGLLDVLDYVANGSFSALKENVEYRRNNGYAVLVRLVDHNANWQGERVYVDESAYCFLSKSALIPGDVVIANVGANAGTVFRVPALDRPATLGPNAVLVRPKTDMSEKISKDYLYYYFVSPCGQAKLQSLITGSAQPKFNKTALRGLHVEFPSITAQQSIAEVMLAIDDRIALLRETNVTLEAIAQALFKSWFVDFDPVHARVRGEQPAGLAPEVAALFPDNFEESKLGMVPKGWSWSVLGNVCTDHGGAIQTGPFGSQLHASDYVQEGTPVVMPKDISGRRVDGGTAARIGMADVERLSRHQLQIGDIVFSRRGDVEKHALIGELEQGWLCGTGCLLVRPGKNWSSPGFLSRLLDLQSTKRWLTQHAVGATMPNLNTGILAAVPVLLPSREVLMEFEQLTHVLDTRISENNATIQTLANLRDTLLPRLISGQLRLPDAEQQLKDLAV